MSQPSTPPTTTQDELLRSLLATASAAQQAYLAAHQADPTADLSKLYLAEINAQQLYLDALNKSFTGSANAASEQAKLDKAVQAIKDNLATLQDVDRWVALVGSAVKLATTVAGFFA